VKKERVRLFQTLPQACGYWSGRTAVNLVLDPSQEGLATLYAQALAHGFRRAGPHLYRPDCPRCTACVACRVPLQAFRPDRSQRRCLARNADVQLIDAEPGFTAQRWALYQRYQRARHPGGGMDDGTADDFREFLAATWSPTRFLELREGTRLLAVAVTDVGSASLSAVYTWFDPTEAARGLGTLAILRQIDHGRARGLQHLYLGYWIAGHPKMDYKRRFTPLEVLEDGQWTSPDSSMLRS
jgi:arginine-tRNA-protein transferase